jgi:hypothetical protein
MEQWEKRFVAQLMEVFWLGRHLAAVPKHTVISHGAPVLLHWDARYDYRVMFVIVEQAYMRLAPFWSTRWGAEPDLKGRTGGDGDKTWSLVDFG